MNHRSQHDTTATVCAPCPRRRPLLAAALALLVAAAVAPPARASSEAVAIPPYRSDSASAPASTSPLLTDKAVLAGGCFWGVQGVFQHVKGVTNAVSGYAGGDRKSATYDLVASGLTAHAEAVEVTFDPRQVSYAQLLQIYFSVAHDPTQLDRQGPDTGPQYRSALFPRTDEQARIAREYIAQLDQARAWRRPIVTRIETGHAFHPAEAYHQDFMIRNPRHPYIVVNDLPKVADLKRLFPDRFRTEPVLVAGRKP